MNCAAHSLIHGPKSGSYSSSPQIRATSRRRAGLRDDDQPLALAEPGRWRPLGEPRDALDDLAVDAAVLEPPDGAPLHDDVDELHLVLLGYGGVTASRGPGDRHSRRVVTSDISGGYHVTVGSHRHCPFLRKALSSSPDCRGPRRIDGRDHPRGHRREGRPPRAQAPQPGDRRVGIVRYSEAKPADELPEPRPWR